MPNCYHLSNTRENNIFKSDAVDFSEGDYGKVDDDGKKMANRTSCVVNEMILMMMGVFLEKRK